MFLSFQTWYTRRYLCLAVAMAGGSVPGPGASAVVAVPAVCESLLFGIGLRDKISTSLRYLSRVG